MARENGQAFNRLRQEREGDRAYHVNEVGFLLAEVCSLPAQLLHHPPALQEGVRHSSRQPFFAQAVNKEGLPSAALALLQSVSSAPPPSSPSLSPLSTVHSVPVLQCHPPTIDKNRRSQECVVHRTHVNSSLSRSQSAPKLRSFRSFLLPLSLLVLNSSVIPRCLAIELSMTEEYV